MKFKMSVFTAVTGLLIFGQNSKAADDGLVNAALTQVNQARGQLALVPQTDTGTIRLLQQLDATLAQTQTTLLQALHRVPPPPPSPPSPVIGHYCAASCKDAAGNADPRYTTGASAPFEAQAKELAINATQNAYGCNFGVVVTGCSDQYSYAKFYCGAACIDAAGNLDSRYVRGSAATSALEALTLAYKKTQSDFSCNFGVKQLKCSNERQPSYCVAACKDAAGNADMRYSNGSTGSSEAEATVNALTTVQQANGCNFGVVVTECSSR